MMWNIQYGYFSSYVNIYIVLIIRYVHILAKLCQTFYKITVSLGLNMVIF